MDHTADYYTKPYANPLSIATILHTDGILHGLVLPSRL